MGKRRAGKGRRRSEDREASARGIRSTLVLNVPFSFFVCSAFIVEAPKPGHQEPLAKNAPGD